MKTIALTAALLACAASVMTAEELSDTTITYNGYTISVKGDYKLLDVDVEDKDGNKTKKVYELSDDGERKTETYQVEEDIRFPFSKLFKKTETGRFSAHSDCFYFGFNMITDSDHDVNVGRSHEVGFTPFTDDYGFTSHVGVSYGVGFNWRNWKLDGEEWYQYEDKKIVQEKLPANIELNYSRIRTFRFIVPVMLEFQSNGSDGFFFRVGAVGEIVPMARLRNVYSIDGEHRKSKVAQVRHNVLGASLVATMGYDNWGLYVRYAPTPVFDFKDGSDMRTITFGFGFFL